MIPKLVSARNKFSKLCAESQLPMDPQKTTIKIEKSARKLAIYSDERLLKEYPARIGRSPIGHKFHEGDNRTPVGSYYICYFNSESNYHLFMGLSYPNDKDAKMGLSKDKISKKKCEEIMETIANKKRPDWYTSLGGEVGIHGGGIDRLGTRGCIALRNEDVEEIWGATIIGTPVEILD